MRLASSVLARGIVFVMLGSAPSWASTQGAFGASGEVTDQTCNQCHSGGGVPNVTLSGPSSGTARDAFQYTVTISGGAGARAGVGISATGFGVQLRSGSSNLLALGAEATHTMPVTMNGSASFTFQLIPSSVGGVYRIYVAGLSANNNGAPSGDRAGTATLTVNVTGVPGGPIIVTPAAAQPTQISGATTAVSVMGADDSGEAALVYSWTVQGPAPAQFTPNDSNAAKNTTARFSKAGNYKIIASLKDPSGLVTTSEVAVNVTSVLQRLELVPESVTVHPGESVQFGAVGKDQFGQSMANPPSLRWSVFGGGNVSQTGVYRAPTQAGGPFSVIVSADASVGAASVTVVPSDQPTNNPSPVTPGSDDGSSSKGDGKTPGGGSPSGSASAAPHATGGTTGCSSVPWAPSAGSWVLWFVMRRRRRTASARDAMSVARGARAGRLLQELRG